MRLRLAAMAVMMCALGSGCGQPAPSAPRPAPAVKLKLLQATQASLESWDSLRGKVVVLEFWAPWCDACVESQPHLNELAARFKDRPVQFISVASDPEPEVRAFLKTHKLQGWVALDPDGSAFEAFGVHGLPHTEILDAKGDRLGETYPELLTAERLEALLAAVPPAKS